MPILTHQARMLEVGRLRLGNKGSKGQPQKLTTWRATSQYKEAVEAIADMYGGSVTPWKADASGPQQWECITEAKSLKVTIAPVSVLSQWMEMWRGGGCLRRCDGITDLLNDCPCQCPADIDERVRLSATGNACKPVTQLSVTLDGIRPLGQWRVRSGGYNASVEISGAAHLLEALREAGATLGATLVADSRTSKKDGRTNRYVVPVLSIDVAFNELAIGMGLPSAAALTGGTAPALTAGDNPERLAIGSGPETIEVPIPQVPTSISYQVDTELPEPELPGDEGSVLAFPAPPEIVEDDVEEAVVVEEEPCPPSIATSTTTIDSTVDARAAGSPQISTPSPSGPPLQGGKIHVPNETTVRCSCMESNLTPCAVHGARKPRGVRRAGSSQPTDSSVTSALTEQAKSVVMAASRYGIEDDLRHELIEWHTEGRTQSAKDVLVEEVAGLTELFFKVSKGKAQLTYGEDGKISSVF